MDSGKVQIELPDKFRTVMFEQYNSEGGIAKKSALHKDK
jgi:hypothetical protein